MLVNIIGVSIWVLWWWLRLCSIDSLGYVLWFVVLCRVFCIVCVCVVVVCVLVRLMLSNSEEVKLLISRLMFGCRVW